jgi:release factor glutamine methyltransferase
VARLRDLVDAARARFVAAGVPAPEAALDAELLMRDVLAWDRAAWITGRDGDASEDAAHTFDAAVARRASREPVAYIRGEQEFYGRPFQVRRGVLIPRPETELLIDEAVAVLAGQPAPRVADIGTGSGCLAVTLALECAGARVVATDISPDALDVARANAVAHGVAGRVAFVETRLLAGVAGPFDVIIANPPYVPETDEPSLAPEVAAHEPRAALYGGPDGLRDLRAIVALAATALAPGGSLVMEIGVGQWPAVRAALAEAGLGEGARVSDDLQGIPRAVVARR